ncbi:hypothetical protein Tco_0856647 [Tanacetum coccineum]|uniref:Uncharacterized protein n=1 Tax=Tanacetum coccineum TaxID=301880 RepID=A0ABQ5B425_9ASTR
MDFDFIPSNDLGSDVDVSSLSGDRNKIYDPGICIEVESTRFLATLSLVIDNLLPFSYEKEVKVFNHGVLAYKEKSSPSSLHRGFKASKLFHQKSPMYRIFTKGRKIKPKRQNRARERKEREEKSTRYVVTDATRVHTYSRRRRAVSTGSGGVSTASRIVSTAGMIQQVNIIIPSSSATKDKEIAQRLQEEIDAAEKQRMAQVHQAAQGFTEMIRRTLEQEYFAAQKAEAKRNKPMTQAQQRTYMSNCIKHMGSHNLQQLKKLSFYEVNELFETTMKRVNTFTPMESDDTVLKVVAGSSKRDAE